MISVVLITHGSMDHTLRQWVRLWQSSTHDFFACLVCFNATSSCTSCDFFGCGGLLTADTIQTILNSRLECSWLSSSPILDMCLCRFFLLLIMCWIRCMSVEYNCANSIVSMQLHVRAWLHCLHVQVCIDMSAAAAACLLPLSPWPVDSRMLQPCVGLCVW